MVSHEKSRYRLREVSCSQGEAFELQRGQQCKEGVLRLECASENSNCWVFPLPRVADALGLGKHLRICLSDKSLGAAKAAGETGAF